MQHVARQPILDSKRHLTAFELLFRDSDENRCTAADLDFASKKTMDTAVLLGLDKLAQGHDVFLNCTQELIVGRVPTLFPPKITVVEVLESVQPTPAVVDACADLRRSGYRIALDDFVPQPGCEALIELADVIKVDVQSTPPAQCARLASKYLAGKRQLLAEKVETEEEFRATAKLGFTLFQGFLFSKPNILSTASIEDLNPYQLRIFRILAQPRLDFVEVESVIKSDPGLCYRLLRLLNSSAFYFQAEIRSILHGLILLGEVEARKWLLLVCAVAQAGRAAKKHLLTTALVRAKSLELIAPRANLPASPLFILGMLSMMDAILDVPIAAIADQVAISPDIRSALIGAPNPARQCLDLILSWEQADWERCDKLRSTWNIPAEILLKAYVEAIEWAKQVSGNS